MCGIVGYVGQRPVQEILLAGLEKVEYRGYDSAGVSVLRDGAIASVRAVGDLSRLRRAVNDAAASTPEVSGAAAVALAERQTVTGIGHTRWATHGRVTDANAHPHFDTSDRVHVVVNGIVENYMVLKRRLVDMGATFTSETDAEVIAHLVAHHMARGSLVEAVRAAYGELEGHYAFVVMSADEPDTLVGARKECPLVVGCGDGEQFVGSDIACFLEHTRDVQYVLDGELVVLRPPGVDFMSADGTPLEREVTHVDWDAETAEKGGYETFMLKEIHDQADAVAETIRPRTLRTTGVDLADPDFDEALLDGVERVLIIAAGTSFHAGLIARYAIEEWARVPVDMDIASEWIYRNPIVSERELVIAITQSGETADTLAAMRLARERGAKVVACTNVRGSSATRACDGVLYTRAGMEVSVAATKTFVCQVATMYLLALRLAELRGAMEPARIASLVAEIKHLPHQITELIDGLDERLLETAERHAPSNFFLYLGRHVGRAVALEGALKLKEISYIATDAYAGGEMKHGPIALLDERTPVVCVATDMPILDKMVSNIEEVRSRGAHVIAITTDGDDRLERVAEEAFCVPRTDWMLQALLAVIPLQLFAYHIARKRGLNVDKPRNLAKTVTVE
ncbi:MAG TPA: glutamine--fructose-6-phosphate transaminase (isomerizing) [Solirubrobacteraceae bacterium]|nr:glutamine--fructose-6-phosphate transaminase (isomerizing) [Solirubrobacteraceae bacterium]